MNNFEMIAIIISVISIFISSVCFYFTIKIKKRYEKLVMRLGNGEPLNEILKKYIEQVNEIDKKDDQIIEYFNNLNAELSLAIRKVGIVKYNLYNTTRNDLSFAIALLDRGNTGVVINSVYGIDNSNVYCKRIVKGTSKDKLSIEEREAIKNAIENK